MVTMKRTTTSILDQMTKPYKEEVLEQHGTGKMFKVRTFEHTVDDSELVWHRDKQHRTVHVLSGNGWKLQKDDSLPEDLTVGRDYYILKNSYHVIWYIYF